MLTAAKSPREERWNFIGASCAKLTEKERLTSAARKVIRRCDKVRTRNKQGKDALFLNCDTRNSGFLHWWRI